VLAEHDVQHAHRASFDTLRDLDSAPADHRPGSCIDWSVVSQCRRRYDSVGSSIPYRGITSSRSD
jgi:hypothetical protein